MISQNYLAIRGKVLALWITKILYPKTLQAKERYTQVGQNSVLSTLDK